MSAQVFNYIYAQNNFIFAQKLRICAKYLHICAKITYVHITDSKQTPDWCINNFPYNLLKNVPSE